MPAPSANAPRQKVKCGRTNSQTGTPCRNWAIKGGMVCRIHGGSAPQVKARAKERLAERAISRTLGELDIVAVANPLTALSELAGEIMAWKELAAARVALLETLARENHLIGNEEVRAEVQVFERAMDRAITVLATIARLNIDERLAKISAEQAELVREVLLGSLRDAGLGGDVQQEVAGHVTRRLRLVAG